jgi:hypothetical protein
VVAVCWAEIKLKNEFIKGNNRINNEKTRIYTVLANKLNPKERK